MGRCSLRLRPGHPPGWFVRATPHHCCSQAAASHRPLPPPLLPPAACCLQTSASACSPFLPFHRVQANPDASLDDWWHVCAWQTQVSASEGPWSGRGRWCRHHRTSLHRDGCCAGYAVVLRCNLVLSFNNIAAVVWCDLDSHAARAWGCHVGGTNFDVGLITHCSHAAANLLPLHRCTFETAH